MAPASHHRNRQGGRPSAPQIACLLIFLLPLSACTQGEWYPRGEKGASQTDPALPPLDSLDPEDPETLPLRLLALTAEQRTQIRSLQEAARPGIDSLRQADTAYREARLALLQAAPFQPTSARQLALRDSERRIQLQIKRWELQHAIFHILTPTQQAQLAARWKTQPVAPPARQRR